MSGPEHPLPKLVVPTTSSTALFMLGAAVFAIFAIMITFGSWYEPNWTGSGAGAPKALETPAREVARILVPDAKLYPEALQRSEGMPVIKDGDIVLDHGFSGGWSVREGDRTWIFSHERDRIVCQVSLTPPAEFNKMIESAGSLDKAAEALAEFPATLVQNTGVLAAALPVFKDDGPPPRAAFMLTTTLTLPGQTESRTSFQYLLWTYDHRVGTALQCSPLPGSPVAMKRFHDLLHSFRMRPD